MKSSKKKTFLTNNLSADNFCKNLMTKFSVLTLLFITFYTNQNTYGQGCCLTPTLNIGTGFNPMTSGVLTSGTDPKWTVCSISSDFQSEIISSGHTPVTPTYPADIIPPLGTWATNPACAWINCFNANTFITAGTYTDEDMVLCRQFTMACAGCVKFNISVADADWITSIRVDGITSSFSQPALGAGSGYWHTWMPATFMVCGLGEGNHTIKITVHEAPTTEAPSGSGLNLYGTITSYDPTGTSVINGFINENNTCCATYQCNMPLITGTAHCCPGNTSALANVECGGTWSSSSTATATVSSSGVVTGITSGPVTITYTDNCGRIATIPFTVDAGPTITGSPGMAVCVGATDALSEWPALPGSWSSSNPAIATIGATTGIVTGVSPGTVVMFFEPPAPNCGVAFTVTVNPLPAPITGTTTICESSTTTLSDATLGGIWSSSNPLIASVGPTTGIVTSYATTGTTIITYTLPTGCFVSTVVTVVFPDPITGGPFEFFEGTTVTLTDAVGPGTWTSHDPGIAEVLMPSSGLIYGMSSGITTITYSILPGCYVTETVTVVPIPTGYTDGLCLYHSEILTEPDCSGTWTVASGGGTIINWSSWPSSCPTLTVTGIGIGSTVLTYTLPDGVYTTFPITVSSPAAILYGDVSFYAGTFITLYDPDLGGTWSYSSIPAGILSLSPTVGTTTIVTGLAAGVATITYTLGTDCYEITTVTVLPVPAAIGGGSELCVGTTETLTDAVPGGTWSSSNILVATVSPTGVVTGVSAGSVIITYMLPDGAYVTFGITVDAIAPITGTFSIPVGGWTTLTDAPSGGTWSSSPSGYVSFSPTIGSPTTVTGLAVGVVTITYTWADCYVTASFTVIEVPAPIVGSSVLCIGTSETLTDAVPGGTWSSYDPGIASVVASTGVVTGVSAGVTTITYTLPDGYYATFSITVSALAPITGTLTACAGIDLILGDATPGGTWICSGTVTTLSPTTVDISGLPAGLDPITYSYGGCSVYATATINPSSATITGPSLLCGVPAFGTYTASEPGGFWSVISFGGPTYLSIGMTSGIATTLPTSGPYPATVEINYFDYGGCVWVNKYVTVDIAPTDITGNVPVCEGSSMTLGETSTDGTWGTLDGTIATVSAGVVTGVSAGLTQITYSNGCGIVSVWVTVNAAPAAISGSGDICAGFTLTLSDGTPGGSWSLSMTPALAASINSLTGVITSVSAGTGTATYTLTDGCSATAPVNINIMPDPISGPAWVCVGSTITLTEDIVGGSWISGDATIATVDGTGLVTGVSAGVVNIDYIMPPGLPSGCMVVHSVTVNATPVVDPITGPTTVGEGLTITLADATPLGTWGCVFGCPALASIDGSGNVTAVTPTPGGMIVVSYTVTDGECSASVYYHVDVIQEPVVCVDVIFTSDYYFDFTSSVPGVTIGFLITATPWPGPIVPLCYSGSISVPSSLDPLWIGDLYIWCSGASLSGVCITSVTYMGCTWLIPRASSCCADANTGTNFTGYRHSQNNNPNTSPATRQNLSVIPNPNSGSFTISGTLQNVSSTSEARIEVLDMVGKTIYKDVAPVDNGSIKKDIILGSDIANGVYLIKVINESNTKVLRFTLER